MNDTINIENALRKFNVSTSEEGKTLVYGLRYVKANGEIGEKLCFKKHGNKMRGTKEAQQKEDSHVFKNFKRDGLMMVQDTLTDKPRNLKVRHLIGFKDNNSDKWQQIIH